MSTVNTNADYFICINGDTYVDYVMEDFVKEAISQKDMTPTILLNKRECAERFGAFEQRGDGLWVMGGEGCGGVSQGVVGLHSNLREYISDKLLVRLDGKISEEAINKPLSMEDDFLAHMACNGVLTIGELAFWDIGTKESYKRAGDIFSW